MCRTPNAASKGAWRARLLAARWALPKGQHDAEAAALATAAVRALHPGAADTICCYLPIAPEPGSQDLLDRLSSTGAQVLLPIPKPGEPLDWAPYTGPDDLRPGRFGIPVPTVDPVGPSAVLTASAVLVPALAVDKHGIRLGRGGGYYDRTLAQLPPSSLVVAVVRDSEIVAELPAEPHDRPVTAALTPSQGLVTLAPR